MQTLKDVFELVGYLAGLALLVAKCLKEVIFGGGEGYEKGEDGNVLENFFLDTSVESRKEVL